MSSRIYIIIFITVQFVSCGRKSNDGIAVNRPGKGEMEELNRYMLEKDRERIMNYIERKNLEMTEAPTGLWYQVIEQGEGAYLQEGNRITMDYECSLLDGTKCYSSEESGPKEVVLGKTGIETGLYEGLKLLRPGAEAIFIIPPFLAYGLPGDGKKIPPRSVIVYKVNIVRAE